MLEIAVQAGAGLVATTKIALGSMMSTARANLSVGPPYDLGVYRNNSVEIDEFRITEDSALLTGPNCFGRSTFSRPLPNCRVWRTSRSWRAGRQWADRTHRAHRADRADRARLAGVS